LCIMNRLRIIIDPHNNTNPFTQNETIFAKRAQKMINNC
jgi:hypothetical protein